MHIDLWVGEFKQTRHWHCQRWRGILALLFYGGCKRGLSKCTASIWHEMADDIADGRVRHEFLTGSAIGIFSFSISFLKSLRINREDWSYTFKSWFLLLTFTHSQQPPLLFASISFCFLFFYFLSFKTLSLSLSLSLYLSIYLTPFHLLNSTLFFPLYIHPFSQYLNSFFHSDSFLRPLSP